MLPLPAGCLSGEAVPWTPPACRGLLVVGFEVVDVAGPGRDHGQVVVLCQVLDDQGPRDLFEAGGGVGFGACCHPFRAVGGRDAAEPAPVSFGTTVRRLRRGDAANWGRQVADEAFGVAAPWCALVRLW